MVKKQKIEDHGGYDETARRIVDEARAAAAGGDAGTLKESLRGASPDERSASARALVVDDKPAYELLHETLRELSIEPTS